MRAYVGATGKELQPMMSSQIGDERLVSPRILSAQPVIEVRNRKDDTQVRTQLQQNAQQSNGVGPARHGNADAVARAHQPAFADVVKHVRAHDLMVMQQRGGCHLQRQENQTADLHR